MSRQKPSLLGRALLGVALLLGFYVLALGSVLACVGLVWVQFQLPYIVPKLILLTVVVGATVAWSLLKGLASFFIKFEPPGPRITAKDEPELFACIESVARELGTHPPERVYLVPDVNAFVAEVGGFLGFGTRRVMGIGIGLLQVDTVQQLRATLAHEYGHFLGGDTRVGPFFYRTRAAILRSIQSLEDGFIAQLFLAYFKLFLRVTSGISREQELTADAESVRVAGRKAHIEGLRREARGGILYEVFLRQEVAPLFNAGYRPSNLFLGFRQASREMLKNGLDSDIDQALAQRTTDPYDTHPALPERIAFAESLPEGPTEDDERLARSLLVDPLRWEKLVSRSFSENLAPQASFKALSWKDAPARVYAPRFVEEARLFVQKAQAIDPGATSTLAAARVALGALAAPVKNARKAVPDMLEGTPKEDQKEAALTFWRRALWVLLGSHLVELGGAWYTAPGKQFSVIVGDREYPVFTWSKDASEDDEDAEALALRIEKIARGEDLTDELPARSGGDLAEDDTAPEAQAS